MGKIKFKYRMLYSSLLIIQRNLLVRFSNFQRGVDHLPRAIKSPGGACAGKRRKINQSTIELIEI